MTIEAKVKLLATLTNRDDAGRHFTQRYSDADLDELESEGLIKIDRPIHETTGYPYSEEYHHVEVTEDGVDLVDAWPEFHPVQQ